MNSINSLIFNWRKFKVDKFSCSKCEVRIDGILYTMFVGSGWYIFIQTISLTEPPVEIRPFSPNGLSYGVIKHKLEEYVKNIKE